ncbi:2-amino-4-hydroxy-6-hydroxymethyldihydropteridine diphosphokinase [Kiloniella laminariae]|uniref:2-amino-4-hydroxy-6-hydroxymethyldihydropteridine pyrophosphokinase n=1 Tax=Kiloniella laminariae TaxID=454162 RepID=A0ABT4LIJ8_9PROT|nr:2-amino-4-hydroxy-6-hydroxymethyldihydropteridine diphosphokinase [Kiloniella laminariae]MCZ4280186.1 2-amino-4-hydroxy-6-hydroxymethyldihydropteridine diphosphokinase [Kiloniella laminariae]
MIIIALGANLDSPQYGLPLQTCLSALSRLEELGLEISKTSRWLKTAPVPVSDQPWYVNGVVEIKTDLSPEELLALLHRVEEEFGRVRSIVNAPRVIDLDLIAYNDFVSRPGDHLVVPHPRMHERAFVLLPLLDLDPDWQHPLLKKTARELSQALPADQETMLFAEE